MTDSSTPNLALERPTNAARATPYALDLFAGPGGWDEGLRLLGVHDILGLENDKDACATAEAAGFKRVLCDVRLIDPYLYRGVVGLIASPPCQTFSPAGKSEGQASLDDLVQALSLVAAGVSCEDAAIAHGLDVGDPRSTLVLEPMRFVRELRPRWIAFEEVVPVLPVWEGYADILRGLGYYVWTGILNAADYGVPQARKRAFLLASIDGTVHPPKPTHSVDAELELFDQRAPWVTMAEALDWSEADCIAANQAAPEAAWNPERALWPLHRPATTVVRSFRPDVIAAPGYRQAGDGPRQNTPGSIAVTPQQMCRLQAIRADYPFKGSGTKQQSLIGAVLPPIWAAAILEPLLAMTDSICTECGDDLSAYGLTNCTECLEAAS